MMLLLDGYALGLPGLDFLRHVLAFYKKIGMSQAFCVNPAINNIKRSIVIIDSFRPMACLVVRFLKEFGIFAPGNPGMRTAVCVEREREERKSQGGRELGRESLLKSRRTTWTCRICCRESNSSQSS